MKKLTALCTLTLLSGAITLALAQQSPSTQPATVTPTTQPELNIALAATPSTSFVSTSESLAAINSGFTPRNSRDHSHEAYGNWPRTGTQWVQYTWSQPISTNKIALYWWNDNQGIHFPKSAHLQYDNGSSFVDLPDAPITIVPNRFNTTTFPEITTTKLRLIIEGDGTFSTGLLQWRVIDSGKSPAFPPITTAGVERSVVGTGATYLNGKIKSINTPNTTTLWTKSTGPGDVTFADPAALSTSATFSTPGDYTLQLTSTSGTLSSSDSLLVHVTPAAPETRLDPVYTTSYTLNSPLWNTRIKNLIVNWIPHCMDELSDVNLKEGGINNFIQAGNKLAGKPFTPHIGYPFADAYTHNTVESMCVALMVDSHGDPDIIKAQTAMRAKLDEWIPIILAAQEPDGYLQTRFTTGTPNEISRNAPAKHWDPRTRGEHEGYTAGYFLESAIAHYLATNGKDLRLYNAAKKLADCWDNNLGPAPKKSWYDGHEEMEQALVRFGRFVNNVEGQNKGDRYIQLAKFLLDCRGRATGDAAAGNSQYDQTYAPVTQQYEAVGHAVRAVYEYSAMADVAMETHNPDYTSAVQSIWNDLVNKKLYVTGGVGSGETSEGFGKDYSLPNSAYCESCSGCGELFFQYKMNLAYHDAKYADLYEDTLYNAILGDVDLDAKNFTYTNPLDSNRPRYLWHNCPCCVGNFPRTLLMLPTWMYAKSSDALYVNLFVGSTVHIQNVADTDLDITQTTDYPWNSNVTLALNPKSEKSFSLKIRIPNHNVSALYQIEGAGAGILNVSVNGESVMPTIDKGYAVITRTWKANDKISFTLPLGPQRVTPSDKIAADSHKVALRYGPLVYNIEAADQNVTLPLADNAPLTAEFDPKLLGGVMTIKSTFTDGSPLLAIPNYARNNRGGRSLVWINQPQ